MIAVKAYDFGECVRLIRAHALDPLRKCGDELREKLARIGVGEMVLFVEQFGGARDVRFRLLHDGHVEEHQRLPEVMIGAISTLAIFLVKLSLRREPNTIATSRLVDMGQPPPDQHAAGAGVRFIL